MAAEKVAQGAMNSSFEIFNVPSRGRGIKSKVLLSKGRSVLSCEPYAFVSRNEKLGKICDSCLSPGDALQRCSCCKMVYYCGQTCQKKAWKTHKLECKYLIGMSPVMPTDTVRLLALLLFKNDATEFLRDLVAHSEQIRKAKSEVFAYMLEMLKMYLDGSTQWSSEEIFKLFCKVNCNAFTICDAELKPIGLGLYQTLTFLNHSCEPNCIAVFIGPTCQIRSIRDAKYGEELCISYTELMRPRLVRQRELRDQYYFECTCSRCVNETEHGSELNGLKCVKKECSKAVGFHPGITNGKTCPECDSDVLQNYNSPSITQLYQKIETSLTSVTQLTHQSESPNPMTHQSESPNQTTNQSERLTQALRICEDLLTEAENRLHSDNYQVLKIVDKTSDICIELEMWNKALHYCKRSLNGYVKFYPKFHPSTALQLYRIGKLEVYLDKLDSGISSLSQARSLLEICYGGQHSLKTQLNELIFQSAQEKNMNEQHRSMLQQ